ncbi:heat shock factor family protein [Sporobolomyces salmoneus]|uniref:heat shock factor family protein n=1 Tax=Sporobolomyces salmoneus TaxID=183962 RepID=UPI003174CCE4
MGTQRGRRRPLDGEARSTRTTPEDGQDGEGDEVDEDEPHAEEEDQRSNDGSSEAEEADMHRQSTSGTRTNSTSSTANDGNGGLAVPTKTQAAFVGKLWSMLCTPALSQLIAWTDDGRAFTVFQPTEFARTVLPQFFKHSNFASFIRQLNMYGFGKRVNDAFGGLASHWNGDGSQTQAWEFQNPAFQRDRPDLLAKIRRKSAKPPSTAAPAPSNRRRPSIVRTTSAKPRRDPNASDGAEDDEEAAPRIGKGQLPIPSVLFGDDGLLPPQSARLVAGLNEFSPQGTPPDAIRTQQRPRPREEFLENPAIRSPTSFPQHQPQYPPPPAPAANSFYHPPSAAPLPSPRSRTYPLAPPPFYASGRPATAAEEQSTRQIVALEAQVRGLSEALFHTQQDYLASRAASYSVLGMLLGIVADLDVGEKRKEQIESCSVALSKLHPDGPVQVLGQAGFPIQLPSLDPSSNSTHLSFAPPPPAGPATQSYQQYNRIPTAESYARSSRLDSLPPPSSSSLPLPYRPSSTPQNLGRPNSPPRPSIGESSGPSQPTPSGLAAQPRFGSNFANPNSTSNRPTSLPSLSSLLGGVPANGERRTSETNTRESEPPEKKMRY